MKKSSPRTSEVTETPSAPMSMPVLSPSAQTSTAASARADEASAPVAPVVEQVDSVHARSAPLEQPGLIAQGAEALSVATAEEAAFAPAMASHPRLAGGQIARPVDPLAAVDSDVVDLPEGQSPELAILAAVVGTGGQFIKCPVAPPECPGSIVAVSRDKRLTLLAVAGQGLSDLRRIAAAFQWMQQNRDLIVMALPQFAISHATPQLRLLVDQADLSAGVLHPFLAGGGVTVQPYRKLRWGRKTGLLLEAA
jgi:hypothetical protein